MTEHPTSARVERADVAVARLPWSVCAAADGDWLIFLDLARNRYQATSLAVSPEIASLRGFGTDRIASGVRWQALAREGLLTSPSTQSQSRPMLRSDRVTWRDLLVVSEAAVWAHRIVNRGALLDAFSALSKAKARLRKAEPNAEAALLAYARFASARIWIPTAFVCLFDSLSLMRFLIANGILAELVFGVRGRPFAAHCWVEASGEILDDGGEACHSFVEIVRV